MASPATKPILLLTAAAAAAFTALRRRQAGSDARQLWREATSDTAR